MELLTAIAAFASVVVGSIAAIVKAEAEDKSKLVFLALLGLVSGGVLYAILTLVKDNSHLGQPYWWIAFIAVSFVSGLVGGGLLKVRTTALLLGGFVWLGGTLRMNWYAIDAAAEYRILEWHTGVNALPWVTGWIVLLPTCVVLSYVAA